MGEGANHDAVDHALQVLGDVMNAFALAQVDVRRREIQRKAAKLLYANFERNPRAQRRLFEDHRQRLALQSFAVGGMVGFHSARRLQEMKDLLR